jgi:hypothetical protein
VLSGSQAWPVGQRLVAGRPPSPCFRPFRATIYLDVDISTNNTSTPTHNQIFGLITQARARQLNNQVSLFLASYSSYLDNGTICSVLLLRNDGQEQNCVTFTLATFGFQNSSTSDGRPDPVCTWIKSCKYFLERSLSLFSYASNLKSISCWIQLQSLFWSRDLFLPTVLRHLILAHWAVYHVESNSDVS